MNADPSRAGALLPPKRSARTMVALGAVPVFPAGTAPAAGAGARVELAQVCRGGGQVKAGAPR